MKDHIIKTVSSLVLVITGIIFSGCKSKTMFEALKPEATGIIFSNNIEETKELNILENLYMYNGGGVAIGDINNDNLPDIYFTANRHSSRLYLNKGNLKFEDITEKAGVSGEPGDSTWTNGVTMADVNGDGWIDIYVCRMDGLLGLKGGNLLYINNGDGTFTEKAEEFGLNAYCYAQQAAFFDFDLDGDLDMFLVNQSVRTPSTYMEGNMRVERDSMSGDRLYENRGNYFVDISKEAGIYGGPMGYGLALSIGDINNDGFPDIYVANDFHENDYLYYNQGDGTFREMVKASMGHVSSFSMGNDLADINNDGLLDLYTLDMKPDDELILKTSIAPGSYSTYQFLLDFGYHDQFARNMLQINQGNLFGQYASFSEVGEMYGVAATDWSWGALLADFDLDGNKDIFITNGIPKRPNDLDYVKYTSNHTYNADSNNFQIILAMIPKGEVKNVAYKNAGDRFEDVSAAWGLDLLSYSNGTAYGDLDNDGDLDLVVNNLNSTASIYRNTIVDRGDAQFLKIKLKGRENNIFGLGTRVTIYHEGKQQMQEMSTVRGWLSSVEPVLVFGFGKIQKLDSLVVDWRDGKKQVIKDPPVNKEIILQYADAVMYPNSNNTDATPKFFNPINSSEIIDYKHIENRYLDFDYERLLPKMISTEGPRMAVGDINNDGLDDIFIGGAKEQPGAIYIQQKNGQSRFVKVENEIFYKDRAEEDVGAIFIDVNKDSLPDLYVVSGSGEVLKDFTGQDRLYINMGNGKFEKSLEHPQLKFNGSCVIKADFNNDGNDDLFVGARSVPGAYGKYPSSRILLGDGEGKLYDFTARILGTDFILGMVTSAVWLEKSRELVVVGEWMPVTILDFKKNPIEKRIIDHSSGWWNTITAADLDNDGDIDFLVGNRGLNSILTASRQFPVSLYVKDFDANSSIDPILTYFKNGIEVPFLGMDEIAAQIPGIKKVYPTYKDFAQSSFREMFDKDELAGTGRWQVETFASVLIENRGDSGLIVRELPAAAQVSPIYAFLVDDFDGDGRVDIMAAGNFYRNQLSIGKFDASYGIVFTRNDKGEWGTVSAQQSGFAVSGEARDIKAIAGSSGERLILISRNNDSLAVFKNNIRPQ